MQREQAKACIEEVVKDDALLDMLGSALAKRAAAKAPKLPEPEPEPAKPAKAKGKE